jgi:DNA-directed RNA polymerase subunit RPC12/RpoP
VKRRSFLGLLCFAPVAFADGVIRMVAISADEAQKLTVYAPPKAPAITGEGRLSYSCAKCGLVLVKNINKGQVSGVAVRCPRCGTLNRLP